MDEEKENQKKREEQKGKEDVNISEFPCHPKL